MATDDPIEIENDAVWQLVDDARAPEAGPTFVPDVMRRVRLADDLPTMPWWKGLLAPAPLAAGALAVAAAVALVTGLNVRPDQPAAPPLVDSPASAEAEATETALAELDDALDQELLRTAAEDPSLFSDEELVAMLY